MNPLDTYTFSDGSTGIFVQNLGNESLFLSPNFDSTKQYAWDDAENYAAGLSYPSDGGSSWRLPLRLESTLISEYAQSKFPSTEIRLWTDELVGTDTAWVHYLADPYTGFVLTNVNTAGIYACPVRTLAVPS